MPLVLPPINMDNHQRLITIPANTLFAYKILPHNYPDLYFNLESPKDWSGIYAQFNPLHAISYLPNHFDRGSTEVYLYQLITNQDIQCLYYEDPRIAISSLSSDEKARILREYIQQHIDITFALHENHQNKALIDEIGQKLQAIVILYDAESMECVIPHNLFHEKNFSFVPLCKYTCDPMLTWRVQQMGLVLSHEGKRNTSPEHSQQEETEEDGEGGEELRLIPLTKDEKEDVMLLGQKTIDLLIESHLIVSSDQQNVNWFEEMKQNKSNHILYQTMFS